METIPGKSYGNNYGGSGATDFDFVEFIKRPTTISRVVSIVFAIVVFGCISAAGYEGDSHDCIFNKNADACHYGVAIGVLAFLACLLFLAVDVQFSSISNMGMRRQLVTADLGFSGIWTFLWFVGFCFLADQWRKTSIKSTYQNNHARAAITFSFFSIFSWATLTLMALQRYRQDDGFQYAEEIPNEYQGGGGNVGGVSDFSKSPYASFPQPSEPTVPAYQQQQQPPQYQQPPQHTEQPFGVPPTQPPVITEYSVPNY